MLYAITDNEEIVVVPRPLAERIAEIRRALPGCSTWAEVRVAVPDPFYEELVDWMVALVHQPPDPEASFPAAEMPDPWPKLLYSQMRDWIPEPVYEALASGYSGAFTAGMRLPAEAEPELVTLLTELGHPCREMSGLDELFDPFSE